MPYQLFWPDYLVLVLILVLYALVGIWFGYRKRISALYRHLQNKSTVADEPMTTDEMFLGNRSITIWPTIGTTMASFLSAISLMGTNAEVYKNGIEFGLMVLAYSIAFPLAAEIYMPVFYKLALCSSNEVPFSLALLYVVSRIAIQ